MYFFDTYAIIELLEGNPAYKPYLKKPFVLTKLNLIELHYHFLKKVDALEAHRVMMRHSPVVVDFDEEVINQANILRLQHKRRDLSTTDCVGYAYAKLHAIPFVTGDMQFKDFENVEFVK